MEDFFAALFMWPQVLAQMARQVLEEVAPKKMVGEAAPKQAAEEVDIVC